MIKVLVADDSIFMRNIISDMLKEEKDIEIVGKARNGKEAVELNKTLKPDVITLDVEMPIMDGLSALKLIMEERPTKVIMLSSLTSEGAKETIEALESGAFDFLPKPSGQISLDIRKVKDELLEKIRATINANVKMMSKKELSRKVKLNKFIKHQGFDNVGIERVVAIGVSTGGPRALQNVIPELPEDLDAAILIVQHMPPKFTKSLADRLDLLSDLRVKEAENGDEIKKGHVYIAPGDYHMIVEIKNGKKIIKLNQEPAYTGHRPSANVLFKSVAENFGSSAIGIIMTGMGGDGAESLKMIKDNGGKTIAQSKETCVVYGMPRVAVEKDAVDQIVDLDDIPGKILELLKK